MKAFLRKFILFLLLVPVVWILGLFAYVKVIPGFMQTNVRVNFYRNFNTYTFKDIDTVKNVDILVAGPSSGFRSFDPRIFGQAGARTFIMGSSAQSPVQTEYLVNKYLDKIKPKMFVYVIDMQSFSSDGAEGWLFLMNNITHYDGGFLKNVMETKNLILLNTLTYNMVAGLFSKPEPAKYDFESYVSNGFVQYNTPYRDTSVFSVTYSKAKCEFGDNQKLAFERIINAVKERNIPIVFVQTPIAHQFFDRVSNPDEFDKYIQSHSGIHYINCNYSNFTDHEMWDVIHMNQSGVDKFDHLLIDSFTSWKLLPIKR